MSRWPIRWRLTAWYAAAMTLILGTVGGAIYVGLQRQLDDELNERLSARAVALTVSATPAGGRPTLDPVIVSGGDDDEMIRLWSADGDLVFTSWRTSGDGLTSEEASTIGAGAGGGEPTVIDSVDVGGEPFRHAVATLADGATPFGVLEVAHSRQDVEDTLGALRLLFLVAAPVTLALALAGGYLVAGRVLAPVEAITSLARRISGADLTERLRLDLPDDELGRLAETFDDMLDRVEGAFERQRRFTGDPAHELRTPLSLIRTRVDLALARERPAGEYREALVELDRDVARLGGLVGTLLTLARSDAGSMTLERRPTDLRETLQSVADQFRETAGGVSITLDAAPGPVAASVDQDLVIQLLVNLMDNAVAHTPAGGTVGIGCVAVDGGVAIHVTDTGTGIPDEHLERLFDRFYRVDTGRTAAAGGVGLGLSICRANVDAHGGTIRVASEAGVGTRVEVTLPATA